MINSRTIYILVSFICICIFGLFMCESNQEKQKEDNLEIRPQMCEYLIECNAENMFKACKHYGLLYPEVVTAQAILESGNFKSKVFRERNNPFGLYDSKNKEYFYFNHWTDAVLAYKNMVQYKYKDGDYHVFLKKLPYATDSEYLSKIKRIEKQLKDE